MPALYSVAWRTTREGYCAEARNVVLGTLILIDFAFL